MRRLLSVFQNNALAAVRYNPGRLEGRILLVRPRVPTRSAPGIRDDDLSGWGPLAGGGVDLRWIGGTHGQMLQKPYIGDLAEHVRSYLAERAPVEQNGHVSKAPSISTRKRN
jgi:thioesterase domain-containing protein